MSLNLPKPPEWITDAICEEKDDTLFFPQPGRNDQAKAAKAICARCPVATKCLTYALDFGPRLEGIWGGATPEDRARLLGKETS